MAKFRILSLDGGGLRGIIPVTIIKEIERRSGKRITDLFDMIAGTSTGGLIACGLSVSDDGKNPKYTISDIEKIYTEKGKLIFPKRNWLESIGTDISSLKNPKFNPDGLDGVLKDLFAEKRMSDCAKAIFVTSYDLHNNEAVLFKYRQAITFPDCNALLHDVCRATSAAPTYLPAFDFVYNSKHRVCIDGGVYMNNPIVGAVVEVSKFRDCAPYNAPQLDFDDIAVLSLGTGHYNSDISSKKVEGWGLLDWAPNIADVMMQAVNRTTTYEAEELLADGNFLRLDIEITDAKYSDMADSSDDARNYWVNETNKQVIANADLMKQLDSFLGLGGGSPAA